ncbi:uncharacterized protein LOC142236224 isoform X2 [Haematobia irritans]|uniref:uncharacterized protein LOC142236224 isoform X2 n=1 Tax=Haematobia irritans TaxID=7368 RepID=UPI003F507D7F
MVHTTVIHQCLMIDVANTTRKEKKRVRPHFTVHGKKPTNPRPLACKADVATTAPRCPTKSQWIVCWLTNFMVRGSILRPGERERC